MILLPVRKTLRRRKKREEAAGTGRTKTVRIWRGLCPWRLRALQERTEGPDRVPPRPGTIGVPAENGFGRAARCGSPSIDATAGPWRGHVAPPANAIRIRRCGWRTCLRRPTERHTPKSAPPVRTTKRSGFEMGLEMNSWGAMRSYIRIGGWCGRVNGFGGTPA